MLGDPFKTTRKMKVPMHSRIGHRERVFLKFVKVMYFVCLTMLIILFIAQTISAYLG